MSVVSKGLAASLLGFSSALLCWHCGFSASTIPEEQKIEDEFPTLPAFLVPVEVRDVPEIGPGHKGVFALTDLEKGTVTWKWTDLVHTYHHDDLPAMLEAMEKNSSREDVRVFLRQGFVLPNDLDFFNSNSGDAGRFVNHSPEPTMGMEGLLRDVKKGEELTMNYSFHGNPEWYQALCEKYGVKTETQIVFEHQNKLEL